MWSIKLSEYRMIENWTKWTKFDKDPLAAEQSSYLTKTVNVYIVYDLDVLLWNPTNNFKFRATRL